MSRDCEPSKAVRVFNLKVYWYLKTFMYMSNHKILFFGTELSEMENHTLECFVNARNEIWISIEMEDYPPSFICLDKSTAIKFAKTLRTEINKIQD